MSDVNIRLSSDEAQALREVLSAERGERFRNVLEQLSALEPASRDDTRPDAY